MSKIRNTRKYLFSAGVLALISIVAFYLFFSRPRIFHRHLELLPGSIGEKDFIAVIGTQRLEDIYGTVEKTKFFQAYINSFFPGTEPEKIRAMAAMLRPISDGTITVALYGSPGFEHDFILLAGINNIPSVNSLIGTLLPDHGESEVYKDIRFSKLGPGAHCFAARGILAVAGSSGVLRAVADLMNGESGAVNLGGMYPWVYERTDKSADAYVLTSNLHVAGLISAAALKYLGIPYVLKGKTPASTLHCIKLDRGLYVNSFSFMERGIRPEGPEHTFSNDDIPGILPRQLLLLRARADFSLDEFVGKKPSAVSLLSAYLESFDINGLSGYTGSKAGFALMGPSMENLADILANAAAYVSLQEKAGDKDVMDAVRDLFGPGRKEYECEDTVYVGIDVPVFMIGRLRLCAGIIRSVNRSYLVAATSPSVMENIIRLSRRSGGSFSRGPAWREISSFFPGQYKDLYYMDTGALWRTLMPVVSQMAGKGALKEISNTDIFSFMGPSGSAAVLDGDEGAVFSYFPMRDLEIELWNEIFSSVKNMLREISYDHL